jgi:THO complex subunit 4
VPRSALTTSTTTSRKTTSKYVPLLRPTIQPTNARFQDLFNRIGPVTSLTLRYDRAGRSDGTAYVTYSRLSDARSAIREFDGANAKGQPIRLSLMPTGPAASRNTAATAPISRNPFDTARMPAKSLFERISAPAGRSASPESDETLSDEIGSHRRGPRRGGGVEPRIRPSDVSKPPPDNIDRYVPGQRSRSRSPPRRRRGDGTSGGRRPGERRERDDSGRRDVRSGRDRDGGRDGGRDADGRRLVNGRPRKTQEELDREMEDYWGGANDTAAANGAGETSGFGVQARNVPEVLVDEDVDMIE